MVWLISQLNLFAGPGGTLIGTIVGSFYYEMSMRRFIMNEQIQKIQPSNRDWDGYYNFMIIY